MDQVRAEAITQERMRSFESDVRDWMTSTKKKVEEKLQDYTDQLILADKDREEKFSYLKEQQKEYCLLSDFQKLKEETLIFVRWP